MQFLPSNLEIIYILAFEAPFCPEPLEPYLLSPQPYYLKASSALDYPLNNFVICDRLKPNTAINQEIAKKHRGELRKKNISKHYIKVKGCPELLIRQKGINIF